MPAAFNFFSIAGPTPEISLRSSAFPIACSRGWNFFVSMPFALAAATAAAALTAVPAWSWSPAGAAACGFGPGLRLFIGLLDLRLRSLLGFCGLGCRRRGLGRLLLRDGSRTLRLRLEGGLGAAGENLCDLDDREVLAMPTLAARVLASALLEGNHLRATRLLDELARDRHARDRRRADLGRRAVDE